MRHQAQTHRTAKVPWLSFVFAAQAAFAAAPDSEASWKALTNEPSRADLFSRYARALANRPGGRQSFAFPRNFTFPNDAQRNRDGTLRQNAIFGIDISHYQGIGIAIEQLKMEQVAFVYVKATQGTDLADKAFGHYWRALGNLPPSLHIPRGAYHFLSSDPAQSGAAQADRFLAYIDLHGHFREGDLPPALDLEWDRTCATCVDRWETRNRKPAEIIATAKEFLQRVKDATGRSPLLYTNRGFLRDVGIKSQEQETRLTEGVKVWIFDVSDTDADAEIANPKYNLPHVLWQFSWGALLTDGYPGKVDVEFYRGTSASFQRDFVNSN